MLPRPRHFRRIDRRPQRASVLVIVLVTVLFASAALVAFIEKASDNLIVDARETIAKRLRQDAYSSLEVVLAVLEDFRLTNGGLHSPAEGWNDPLGFAGWTPRDGCTVEVSFEDESGKMSLVNADPAAMLELFEAWGLPQRDAEKLRDSLLSWMRKDYVAPTTSSADYEHAVLPYHAPNRGLRTYAELAAIDEARKVFFDDAGRPNEAFQKFVGAFSLFNFKQVNINGARREAVDYLTWIDPSQRQRFADYLYGTGDRARSGPGYFENTADAARIVGVKSLPSWMGTDISALRVNVLVRDGGTSFRVSAVVAPSGGATVVEPAPTDASNTNQTGSNAPNPNSTSSAGAPATAKKLNYPFTLLEITENAVISTVPAAPKA